MVLMLVLLLYVYYFVSFPACDSSNINTISNTLDTKKLDTQEGIHIISLCDKMFSMVLN